MQKLSIISVSYNAASTIRDCLESVHRQSIEVEHLLIDGQSDDDTTDIAEEYKDHLATIISEPDNGIYDAMNKGLQRATGDIVGILNSDDFYPSADILARVAETFSDPQIDACYGDLVYVESDTAEIDHIKVVRYWKSGGFDYRKFYWGWMPPHPTFFVRRSAYEKYGLFNLDLGSAADYELMLRFLLKYRLKAVYIPQVLVHMRTGGVSNASLVNRLAANRMDRKAWQVNDLKPYPWTLWMKPLRKIGQWVFR